MKVLVLIAGCIGAVGFFEPYFHDGAEPVSAYRIASMSRTEALYRSSVIDHETGRPMSREKLYGQLLAVPFYFLSALVFLVAGFAAIVVGRLSFIAGLGSAAAALLALGGYMHELNAHRMLMHGSTNGATLLLVSGLLGLVGSIVVLVKREPDPPKPPKPPPALPVARVIS